MMNMENRDKMIGFMMDMCCTGMTEENKQKVKEKMEACCKNIATMMPQFKDMFKDMPEGFKSCCGQKDFAEFFKHCFAGAEKGETKT